MDDGAKKLDPKLKESVKLIEAELLETTQDTNSDSIEIKVASFQTVDQFPPVHDSNLSGFEDSLLHHRPELVYQDKKTTFFSFKRRKLEFLAAMFAGFFAGALTAFALLQDPNPPSYIENMSQSTNEQN